MVALSGGVDSAVAALLLRDAGYRVSCLFMKNWEEDDREGYCAAAADLEDAQAVCAKLDLPLHTANFSHDYWERVFKRFLSEYAAGRTPNPDVLCNREIKFDAFLERAQALGADWIATGHYAGVRRNGDGVKLLRGADPGKDQSYFLHALPTSALAKTLFPLAKLRKEEVRALARRAGLPVHDKEDSTGICFIGERRFRDFLARYLPPRPGEIRDLSGRVLGTHEGLMYYTLGQRHGLGIGGAGEPWYVAAKDLRENVLTVVRGHNHLALFSRSLEAGELRWIAGMPPPLPFACTAKTRYRQADQECVIEAIANGIARVGFSRPQRAVTPGQYAVFYDNEVCLGGGAIETTAAPAVTCASTVPD
jgi:tRNA-specific 2-thiouridylase